MDYLWSPWRYQYISNAAPVEGCVFCHLLEQKDDESSLIVYRGQANFIVLNLFPYASGHLLIVPYAHISLLSDAPAETSNEMFELTKQAQRALLDEYRPAGFNIGMNLGQAAGAGVAGHIHMHILPRWFGDINFTTAIGETRVLPETLSTTYQRIKKYFS
jgi:ATP adenylyltransferase